MIRISKYFTHYIFVLQDLRKSGEQNPPKSGGKIRKNLVSKIHELIVNVS